MFEKIIQWDIVKYIGSLINSKNLSKQLSKVMELYETNTLGQVAKRLFIWSIVIIFISTIVDQIFYWSRPEQRIKVSQFLSHVIKYKKILFDKVGKILKREKG